MRSHRFSALATILALGIASPALANDYVSEDANDWFRYREATSGQEVESRMVYDLSGWRMWSNFAGLGDTFIYTEAHHDWLWLWNGQGYTLVGDLGGAVGSTRAVDMPPCNRGTATIARRGTLQTPAGAFNDVTEVQFRTSCADAGVTGMWFAKGVGLVRWTEQSIAGPRTYELAQAFVGGQHLPGASAPTNPTAPTTSNRAVAPSEHVTMETVLWGANDTYLVLDTYEDAFRGLHGSGVRSQVAVTSNYVASQLRYELQARNVPLTDVEFLLVDLDSVWMRDYGPLVLRRPNGERIVADLDYYYGRFDDDVFPEAYAAFRGWPRIHVALSYEGGNFVTDGRGTAMTSLGVKWFNDTLSETTIGRRFADLGCDQVVYVEPLVNEGTTHIDMFARVMNDTHAMVSRYPAGHRQARVCDDAARAFQSLGYQVIRVDVDHTYDEFGTYTNSLLANGLALVPQYANAARNRAALQAYEQCGYRAIGIDSRLIIQYGGATHCMSMQVPAAQ